MLYRLDINPRDPMHPAIVEDADGQDRVTVLFELLRFHVVWGNDHHKEIERVLDEIGTEARG
jgi:hypothetical protein